jgi:hypothetical protein
LRRDILIRRESTIVKTFFPWRAIARGVKINRLSIGVWSAVVHDLLELSLFPSIKEVSVKVPSTVDSWNGVAIGENIGEFSTAIIRDTNEHLHLWQSSRVS